MCDSPYEHDALGWAEEQSALLRRLAAGEGVNAAVDWPHVDALLDGDVRRLVETLGGDE